MLYQTPAKVLAQHFGEITQSDLFEVLDFSRTNERLSTLIQTITQAMQLQPDLLVVFVGNNWNLLETPHCSPYYPSAVSRKALAGALQEQGILGPVEMATKQRLESVGQTLTHLETIAGEAGIPVVLVNPEVNLADWETRQPVTWLPGNQTAQWHQLYQEASIALATQNWKQVASLANQMLDLDGGTCPATFRFLAYAQGGVGNEQQAQLAARAEVNSNNYATLCFLGAPQATVVDQELLRRAAKHHGFILVDLPNIFSKYANSPLPGRQLFLDYCHFTSEGMQVAMAAVSSVILQQLAESSPSPPWYELVQSLTKPSVPPHIEATVYLGAAIHTAHRLLPVHPSHDIIRYWLDISLATFPAVAQAMLALAEMRSSAIPPLMTTSQRQNFESMCRLGFQHGLDYKYIDAVLLAAMQSVLAEKNQSAAAQLTEILVNNCRDSVELLHPPFYLWQPLAQFFPDVMDFADQTHLAYMRAPWPESSLSFLAHGIQDMKLSIVARLPYYDDVVNSWSGTMLVSVNGRSLHTTTLKQKWRRITVNVPKEYLQPGLNKLTIYWPALPPYGSEMMTNVIKHLEDGLWASMHPIFGELFSVKTSMV